MSLDMIRNPFGKSSNATRAVGDPLIAASAKDQPSRPDQPYVVQRTEDKRFLGNDNKPADDLNDAQTFDSHSIAKIWADRATARHPGSWSAIPSPERGPEPEDDSDLDAGYNRLSRKAA